MCRALALMAAKSSGADLQGSQLYTEHEHVNCSGHRAARFVFPCNWLSFDDYTLGERAQRNSALADATEECETIGKVARQAAMDPGRLGL